MPRSSAVRSEGLRAVRRRGREGASRFDADRADRITKQGRGERDSGGGLDAAQREDGAVADQRVGVRESRCERAVLLRTAAEEGRRRRAPDGRLFRVFHPLSQKDGSARALLASRMDRLTVRCGRARPLAPPLLRRRRRPDAGAIGVALRAGIRRPERGVEIRPGDPETVVMAGMDDHVVPRRHVTGDAPRSGRSGGMEVVLRRIELLGGVARHAHAVGRALHLERVRIVAVRARDTGGVHLALEEGAVLVDLVLDLAVGKVKALLEQRRPVGLHQGLAEDVVGLDDGAARMTARAGFDLRRRGPRNAPLRDAGRRVDVPGRLRRILQGDRESFLRIIGDGLSGERRLGPGDVRGARPVAGLTGDVELRPGRRVGVRGRRVALPHVRRVTVRAHEVPVLVGPGPVQRVGVRNLLFRVEMKPALAALLRGPRVPHHVQRLQTPPRKRNQVLLERRDAEGVGDRILVELAVGPVGPREELALPLEERRRDAVVGEAGAVEVAENRLLRRFLHREVVVRALPAALLFRVTARARIAADEGRRDGLRRKCRRRLRRGRPLRPAAAGRRRCQEADGQHAEGPRTAHGRGS